MIMRRRPKEAAPQQQGPLSYSMLQAAQEIQQEMMMHGGRQVMMDPKEQRQLLIDELDTLCPRGKSVDAKTALEWAFRVAKAPAHDTPLAEGFLYGLHNGGWLIAEYLKGIKRYTRPKVDPEPPAEHPDKVTRCEKCEAMWTSEVWDPNLGMYLGKQHWCKGFPDRPPNPAEEAAAMWQAAGLIQTLQKMPNFAEVLADLLRGAGYQLSKIDKEQNPNK